MLLCWTHNNDALTNTGMNDAAVVCHPADLPQDSNPSIALVSGLEICPPHPRPHAATVVLSTANRHVFLAEKRLSPHFLARSCLKEALVPLLNECQLPMD